MVVLEEKSEAQSTDSAGVMFTAMMEKSVTGSRRKEEVKHKPFTGALKKAQYSESHPATL